MRAVEALFILVPLSLVLVYVVVWALLWAIRTGQFDDLEGPAHRLLMDEDEVAAERGDPGAAPPAGDAIRPPKE